MSESVLAGFPQLDFSLSSQVVEGVAFGRDRIAVELLSVAGNWRVVCRFDFEDPSGHLGSVVGVQCLELGSDFVDLRPAERPDG